MSFKFNEKVEELINLDPNFRNFINQIDIALKFFLDIKSMSIASSIFFEEDWEIPDYEKLVLLLNFKGIPFNEELEMWKTISSVIFERLEALILKGSEQEIKIIKEWKRKFFIKVDM